MCTPGNVNVELNIFVNLCAKIHINMGVCVLCVPWCSWSRVIPVVFWCFKVLQGVPKCFMVFYGVSCVYWIVWYGLSLKN